MYKYLENRTWRPPYRRAGKVQAMIDTDTDTNKTPRFLADRVIARS